MKNNLPNNWVETNIKTISNILRGVSYKKNEAFLEPFDSSTYILRGGNIQDEKIDFETNDNVYVSENLIQQSQLIKKNDVVIVGSTGSKKLIGKAGIADADLPKVSFGAFLMLLRTNVIDKKFHSYFFQTLYYRNSISNLAGGVNINNIKKEHLENLIFPLPPLPEQERIVAKLDALFAQHEAMKKALERIPQLLKDFRQQVLINAVSGKLTETWRNNNPQNLTLEDIFHQQIQSRNELIKNKKIKKIKTFDEIQNLEKDLDTPKSWKWIRWLDLLDLNNLAMKRGPFGSALKKDFFIEKGVRVFEQYNPINDDPYFQRYYISEDKYEELKSFRAQPKDLLISCSGVTLGRITEIPDDTEAGIINQALLKVTLNSKLIFNKYFIRLFRSEYIQKKIFDKAKGSAIPNMVGVDILKKMPLPIPPPEEQQKILSIIESLFNRADTIEKRYKTLKEKINSLPQAILHKAFKGELVPQLPTDGDAKDLLEEILKLKKEVKKK